MQQHNALLRILVDRSHDRMRNVHFFQISDVSPCQFYLKCSCGIVEVSRLGGSDDRRGNSFCPLPCQRSVVHRSRLAKTHTANAELRHLNTRTPQFRVLHAPSPSYFNL